MTFYHQNTDYIKIKIIIIAIAFYGELDKQYCSKELYIIADNKITKIKIVFNSVFDELYFSYFWNMSFLSSRKFNSDKICDLALKVRNAGFHPSTVSRPELCHRVLINELELSTGFCLSLMNRNLCTNQIWRSEISVISRNKFVIIS